MELKTLTFEDSFFLKETRWDYSISPEMKKVWACELDLLQKLLNVCKENNLKIWIDGGTLLGAVRHKGYIPWDDDIDLVMFRQDYDKLVELGPQLFKEPYFLQNLSSEKLYFRSFSRLRNSSTTCLQDWEQDMGLKTNKGIFIDIFVMDNVSPDKSKHNAQSKKIAFYHRAIRNLLRKKHRHPLAKLFTILLKLVGLNYIKLCNKLALEIQKFNSEKTNEIGILCFTSAQNSIRERKWYDETVYLDFEGLKVPAPKEYDAALKKHYGDYMVPLKTGGLHLIEKFDTDKPFTEYEQNS